MDSVDINDHEGPDAEQRYNSTLSLTSDIDWSGWPKPRHGCFMPGKETQYPLYRRLDGPQGWSGTVWKISHATGVQSPYRPARSWSLYRHVQGYCGFLVWCKGNLLTFRRKLSIKLHGATSIKNRNINISERNWTCWHHCHLITNLSASKFDVLLEVFTATEFNKMFSGWQPQSDSLNKPAMQRPTSRYCDPSTVRMETQLVSLNYVT